MQALSKDEMYTVVQMNRMGIISFVFVEIIFFVFWMFALGIPGFALYDGGVNTCSAYTHGMWWMVVEFAVIIGGLGSIWFGLGYDRKRQRYERNVTRTESWIDLYCLLLFAGCASNLIHFGLTICEIVPTNCSGTLCKNYYWVLVCLLIFLLIVAFLQFIQVFRVRGYKNNLHAALSKLDASLGVDDEEQDENDLEAPLLPSAPVLASVSSRIRDPHGFQKKIKK
jgi:hypothetical protein